MPSSTTTTTMTPASAAADLTTLQVQVAELCLTPEGTWVYVLQVACGRARWQVQKRYREIRALWEALGASLKQPRAGQSCPEHCHFLAGLEQDKFPKRHLLHTQHKLTARARQLDVFFLKLGMRLNLCSARELESCRQRGCPVLALVSDFFEADARAGEAKTQAMAMAPCRSVSLQRQSSAHEQHYTTKRRRASTLSRRLSFGLLGERGDAFQNARAVSAIGS